MTALPAKSAGTTGQKTLWKGKFHGHRTPTTPRGVVLDACGLVHEDAGRAGLGREVLLALGDEVADLLAHGEDLAHAGVEQGLAGVARADAGDVFLVVDDVIEEGAEDVAALGKGRLGPVLLRAAGPLDALADGLRVEGRDLAEPLEGRRVAAFDGGEVGAGTGRDGVGEHARYLCVLAMTSRTHSPGNGGAASCH